jgi:hypothetical protein
VVSYENSSSIPKDASFPLYPRRDDADLQERGTPASRLKNPQQSKNESIKQKKGEIKKRAK